MVATDREFVHEIREMLFLLANSSEIKFPAAPESSRAVVATRTLLVLITRGTETQLKDALTDLGVQEERRDGQVLR